MEYMWFLKLLLEYSCFTMLCSSLLYSKVNQLYAFIHSLFFRFPFRLGPHRALSRNLCAIQQVLISYLYFYIVVHIKHYSMYIVKHYKTQNSNLTLCYLFLNLQYQKNLFSSNYPVRKYKQKEHFLTQSTRPNYRYQCHSKILQQRKLQANTL